MILSFLYNFFYYISYDYLQLKINCRVKFGEEIFIYFYFLLFFGGFYVYDSWEVLFVWMWEKELMIGKEFQDFLFIFNGKSN
jgi:hypothetical protein